MPEFIDKNIGCAGQTLRYILNMSTREVLIFGDDWSAAMMRRMKIRFKEDYNHLVWFGGIGGEVRDGRITLICGAQSAVVEPDRGSIDAAVRTFQSLGNIVSIRQYNL